MLKIVALSRNHNRAAFDCGIPSLNNFLRATARQHSEKGLSRTFVLAGSEYPSVILGFFTLTLCGVVAEQLPRNYAALYPNHRLPAVRLGRLAVSRKYQRKGYGSLMLAEAVQKTLTIAGHAGTVGLFVDAKDNSAHNFYKCHGFITLPVQDRTLFLPLATLMQAAETE